MSSEPEIERLKYLLSQQGGLKKKVVPKIVTVLFQDIKVALVLLKLVVLRIALWLNWWLVQPVVVHGQCCPRSAAVSSLPSRQSGVGI